MCVVNSLVADAGVYTMYMYTHWDTESGGDDFVSTAQLHDFLQ